MGGAGGFHVDYDVHTQWHGSDNNCIRTFKFKENKYLHLTEDFNIRWLKNNYLIKVLKVLRKIEKNIKSMLLLSKDFENNNNNNKFH